MKRKRITFITTIILFLLIIVFLIPTITSNRLKDGAPKLLKMNGYTIIQDNGFNGWMDREEYIVTKDGIRDTIKVVLVKGVLVIQP